jgi:hypothetical protein
VKKCCVLAIKCCNLATKCCVLVKKCCILARKCCNLYKKSCLQVKKCCNLYKKSCLNQSLTCYLFYKGSKKFSHFYNIFSTMCYFYKHIGNSTSLIAYKTSIGRYLLSIMRQKRAICNTDGSSVRRRRSSYLKCV